MYLNRFYTIEELQACAGSGDARAGAGDRARIFPAREDCRDGGRSAGRLPPAARSDRLLKYSIRSFIQALTPARRFAMIRAACVSMSRCRVQRIGGTHQSSREHSRVGQRGQLYVARDAADAPSGGCGTRQEGNPAAAGADGAGAGLDRRHRNLPRTYRSYRRPGGADFPVAQSHRVSECSDARATSANFARAAGQAIATGGIHTGGAAIRRGRYRSRAVHHSARCRGSAGVHVFARAE